MRYAWASPGAAIVHFLLPAARVPAAAALLALPLCGAAPGRELGPGAGGRVEHLAETRLPFPAVPPGAAPQPLVDRAYFDAGNQLRWDGRPVHSPPAAECPGSAAASMPASPAHRRHTHLADPRVDECIRPGPPGRGTRKSLLGLDAQGRLRWERPLVFLSGEVPIELWLIGATPEGLVLSDLEVWSPQTGETLVPPRTRNPAADRPVPDHRFTGSALYAPGDKAVLVFQADVTLLRREGGLYRIGTEAGGKELWLPVSSTLLGTYDRVESMALSRDGRYVLLGTRQTVRGPSSVSVAVLDLKTRERLFEERHGRGQACSAPQVVAGAEGHFGFAYRDESAGAHVLVRYRVRP